MGHRPVLTAILVGVWAVLPIVAGAMPPGSRVVSPPDPQHRLVVLTDIEADPDDTQSLIRLLTYSNVIDVRGLIATTSVHMQSRIAPQSIHRVIDAYAQARPNLLKHEPGFPSRATLRSLVKAGLPEFGMQAVGSGKDSSGSDWIIAELHKPDPRPLWIAVWGGPNVLAQALWRMRETLEPSRARAAYEKLRVYAISDQDDSGPWIRREFPSVFYICSPGSYRDSAWIGMPLAAEGANNEVISDVWLARNIQQGHGPLGAAYPDVAYGMEGDTPSFLGLIPNGLNHPQRPDYGGWGGRYELYQPTFNGLKEDPMGRYYANPRAETRPLWTNAEDSYSPQQRRVRFGDAKTESKTYKSASVTVWRWREEVQHDFAARMHWATKDYADANHPPVPVLAHPEELSVRSGEDFHLDATGSHDPDGDSLSYLWFQYPEAGDYPETVSFGSLANNLIDLTVKAPQVEVRRTLHFILKVTDKGQPALTRYKRVIVQVDP